MPTSKLNRAEQALLRPRQSARESALLASKSMFVQVRNMESKIEHSTLSRVTAALATAPRWWTVLVALASASCAIEGSEACSDHQVRKKGSAVINYNVCVCDEANGYVFDVARGYGCVQCAEGQSIVDGKCSSPRPDAQVEEGDATTKTEPTGVGEPCKMTSDCAAFDATYCAAAMGVCLVEKCAKGENACGSNSTCCDFSALLAGFSICVPEGNLNSGNCPMGGMKVEP